VSRIALIESAHALSRTQIPALYEILSHCKAFNITAWMIKLIVHFLLVSRLRISGALPPGPVCGQGLLPYNFCPFVHCPEINAVYTDLEIVSFRFDKIAHTDFIWLYLYVEGIDRIVRGKL